MIATRRLDEIAPIWHFPTRSLRFLRFPLLYVRYNSIRALKIVRFIRIIRIARISRGWAGGRGPPFCLHRESDHVFLRNVTPCVRWSQPELLPTGK